MPCSALIVEDHPMFRDALSGLVRGVLGENEVLAVSSAEQGLKAAAEHPGLQLILLDPGLPGLSGPAAILALRQACPQARLIAVSVSDDRREAQAALQAGALAFVSKAVSPEQLAEILLRALSDAINPPEWLTPRPYPELPVDNTLTERQLEILQQLCHGHSNKEIALRLGLAVITVKLHVSSIFRSLGVANRTQAVLAARRLGLEDPA